MLVLRTLEARGPLHGYGLCAHVQQITSELLRIEEGSLYPALRRMEQDGWLKSSWQVTENGRNAKMYSITARGRAQLAAERESWERLTRGVAQILRYSS